MPGFGLLATFAGLCAVVVVGSILSDIGTNYVGQHVIARLREELSRKILLAPIDQIERFRTHRLIPVLTHDVDVISDFAFNLAPLAVSLSVTLGCLAYMAALSWPMFLVTLVAIVIGCRPPVSSRATAASRLRAGARARGRAAEELSRDRRRAPRSCGSTGSAASGSSAPTSPAPSRRIRDIQIRSINLFVVAKVLGSSLFFIVIGMALAFHAVGPGTDKAALSGFVLVLLYMKGPLEHRDRRPADRHPSAGRLQAHRRAVAPLRQPEPHLAVEETAGRPGRCAASSCKGATYAFPAAGGCRALRARAGRPCGSSAGEMRLHRRRQRLGQDDADQAAARPLRAAGRQAAAGRRAGDRARDAGRLPPALHHRSSPTITCSRTCRRRAVPLPAEAASLPASGWRSPIRSSVADGRFSTLDLSTGQRKRLALIQAWVERAPGARLRRVGRRPGPHLPPASSTPSCCRT